MTCQWTHQVIGETYEMDVSAKCGKCGTVMHTKSPMIYLGHKNVTTSDGRKYHGDAWEETPPIHCPYCAFTTGKFAIPCPRDIAEELFIVASVPVDAVAKVTE